MLYLSLIALSLAVSSYSALYESASSLPATEYDFVVIGGGTAGNVIANRLTEDPSVSVLVLEAGGSNIGVLDSIVPFFVGGLLGATPYNWNYTTVQQQGLSGRSIPYPRGHLLGGSSSINGMFYTRGSAEDFDRYARVTGDQGWSWNSLQPYIRKNEHWREPTDHHNTTGQFDPMVHGFTGINSVSLAGFPSATDGRVIETTKQLSDEFPFNLDMNSGKPLGLGWLQSTIDKGHRSSSATSYLAPEFINRPNLHVLINSRVLRIVKTSSDNTPLEFKAVEFTQDVNKSTSQLLIHATKEVILSAGVIGTPNILMHSGIGDRSELNALGIESLHHLPSVGKNASDQPFLGIQWVVNSTDTLDTLNRNQTLFNEAFKLWNETGGGPFGNLGPTHVAWLRLPQNASIFEQFPDPAAGAETPHIELVTENAGGGPAGVAATGNFFSIGVAIVSTESRGSVRLSSKDPLAAPLIDPALLSTEFDMFAMRSGIESARRFVSAPVWKDYIIGLSGGLEDVTTDEELDQYIRNNTATTLHLVGTAAMSAEDANFGVVDPDLRVKGIAGLRIIDSSIFPFVPSAHTQAPTYIVAERGADLIKASWNIQ